MKLVVHKAIDVMELGSFICVNYVYVLITRICLILRDKIPRARIKNGEAKLKEIL